MILNCGKVGSIPTQDTMIELYLSGTIDGAGQLLGPIEATVLTINPNQTIIFKITDPVWKERLGWKPDSNLEVQASPLEGDIIPHNTSLKRRNIWQDVYVWKSV